MKYIISTCLLFAYAPISSAQVSEVRVGVAVHDIGVIDSAPPIEKSVALNAEIIFDKPDFLKFLGSPRPYVGGTLNVGGGTSYGGAGLMWRQNFGKKLYGDFAFGLVAHDGTNEVELSESLRRAIDEYDGSAPVPDSLTIGVNEFLFRRGNSVEYGSRILFREQLTVGYKIDSDWAFEGFFEHISHGNLLSDGPNDGSDAAGFRLNRRF